ncbi:hypothetical protein VNO78_07569 [Psophocarpus tetragonolobus]|uniref:Uncharacterized protein n=1 Tax=Psophocarpus tetragonolobus TaxID=3891 RepID=A0AAN9T3F1_PSOTE
MDPIVVQVLRHTHPPSAEFDENFRNSVFTAETLSKTRSNREFEIEARKNEAESENMCHQMTVTVKFKGCNA